MPFVLRIKVEVLKEKAYPQYAVKYTKTREPKCQTPMHYRTSSNSEQSNFCRLITARNYDLGLLTEQYNKKVRLFAYDHAEIYLMV